MTIEFFVSSIFFGLIAAYWAAEGRNRYRWFCIGAIFSIFGAVAALLMPPVNSLRCADCKELVRKDASVCNTVDVNWCHRLS